MSKIHAAWGVPLMTYKTNKALFILGELNNDDLEWISHRSRKEVFPPGKILIHEGKKIDALYIVLEGVLDVMIESLGNKELALIGQGEIVGEISFIDDRPPLATVKVLEEATLLTIPRFQLTSKLQQDLGFAARFYHGISLFLSYRMRGTVMRLGYGFESDELDRDEIDENMRQNLSLAEAKFNWLVQSSLERS